MLKQFRKYILNKNFVFLLITFVILNIIFQPFNSKPNDEPSFNIEYLVQKEDVGCRKEEFDYMNSISIQYLKKDTNQLYKLFKQCESQYDYYVDLVKITELNAESDIDEPVKDMMKQAKFNLDMELFLIELDLDYFKPKKHKQIECYAELFDKKLNVPERNEQMLGIKYEFLKEYNYKFVSNRTGFYYISCNNEKFDRIFHNVYNILPKNLTRLVKNVKSYLKHVDAMKKDIADSKDNPMLVDLEYKECEPSSDEKINNNNKESKLNVLIICIDSMSFNHFKRVFPLTYYYLNSIMKNNIIFENYNVVGEKTYSNILPFLTGLVVDQNGELNITTEVDYFRNIDSTFHDYFPFAWRDFEGLDYLTSYSEDEAPIGIFNLIKNGFRYWPTHFYAQPFWFKYDQIKSGPHLCHNKVPTYITSLSIIEQLMKNFNEYKDIHQKSYFSFNFLKYYTHNYLAIPQNFDNSLKEMLHNFEKKGYLDDTLLVIMGDHGNRLTNYFSDTDYGKIEHKNPLLSIRVPDKLKKMDYYKNMARNKYKLISPFDLHKTLKHFYYINKNENSNNNLCRSYFKNSEPKIRSKRGVSLFESISSERTCTEALIPSIFCNCNKYVEILEEKFLKDTDMKYNFNSSSHFILDHINNVTNSFREQCVLFELVKIISVKKVFTDNLEYYEFYLLFQPGDAIFKANLIFSNETLSIYENIIRISLYKSQSACVNDHRLAGFCYCRKQL